MSDESQPDQLSGHRVIVLVAHEPGSLAQVTGTLAQANINIESVDARLLGQMGAIVLRTSDDEAAVRALHNADLRAVTSDQIIFHLPDRPGALAAVAQEFADQQINVRTIHIVHRYAGEAVVAVSTDDDPRARAVLDPESLL